MSVNGLQALTPKFADAFDQRDLQPFMEMLSEDVEVFDLYGDTVGIVNAYDMFMEATKEGKVRPIHGRTTLAFIKQSGQWKIVSAHFSAIPQALWEWGQGMRPPGDVP